MIVLVASKKDAASLNIAKQILSRYTFQRTGQSFQENPVYEATDNREVELVTLKNDLVYGQEVADYFPGSELIVFISRHSSATGTPTLSVHTPGNLSEAKRGGIPRKVSVSAANAMRHALRSMMLFTQERQIEYDVSYEATHHGPSLDVPTMFVELGSSPEQWNDLEAAEAVAHAAMEAVSKFDDFAVKAVVGIGGPHYNRKFTKMALRSEVAFGHMIPKYAVPKADSEILRQCVERTLEKVELAVLDWKGIRGRDKSELVEMLDEVDLSFQKV